MFMLKIFRQTTSMYQKTSLYEAEVSLVEHHNKP